MIEALERIEDKDRQEEIDEFIIEHSEDFIPYMDIFEEVTGEELADWDERYLEGHSSGVQKYYETMKDGRRYSLSVSLIQHEEIEKNLFCEMTIRDVY